MKKRAGSEDLMWTLPPGLLDMCPALTSSNTGDDGGDLIAGSIVLGEHNKRGQSDTSKTIHSPTLLDLEPNLHWGALNTNQT